jgi:hypothetical protein
MTSKYILDCKLPGDLFTDPKNLEKEFRELCKKWHPDKNKDPKAAEVQMKINAIHDLAEKQIAAGIWESTGKKVLKSDGMDIVVDYQTENPFELGVMWVCNSAVVFYIKEEYQDMADHYVKFTKTFKFASKRMKDDVERYLPHVTSCKKLMDESIAIAVEKPDDIFLLNHVIKYYDGKIPPRHAAWILNTLYNLCCYFQHAGISHNALTVDNYFICPQHHSGVLLGGWFYSSKLGGNISYVPTSVFPVLPLKVIRSKKASRKIDLECIRLIGRTMLGDKNGNRLYLDKDIPAPMVEFLRGIAGKDAIEEYKEWAKVLEASFGKRRFVEMRFDTEQFYKKIKGAS